MGKVLSYVKETTGNVKANAAMSKGLLYGVNSSSKAVAATNASGAYIVAAGFAVDDMTTAQATNNDVAALTTQGVVEFSAANIEGGALTPGAPVYLHTAGGVTTTRPTAAGTLIQAVGVALTATKVLLNVAAPIGKAQAAATTDVALL